MADYLACLALALCIVSASVIPVTWASAGAGDVATDSSTDSPSSDSDFWKKIKDFFDDDPKKAYSIVGACAVVLALVLILCIGVCCCCFHRWRRSSVRPRRTADTERQASGFRLGKCFDMENPVADNDTERKPLLKSDVPPSADHVNNGGQQAHDEPVLRENADKAAAEGTKNGGASGKKRFKFDRKKKDDKGEREKEEAQPKQKAMVQITSDDNSGSQRSTVVGRGRPGKFDGKKKKTVDAESRPLLAGNGSSSSEEDGYAKQPSKPQEHTSHTPASSGGKADGTKNGGASGKKKFNFGRIGKKKKDDEREHEKEEVQPEHTDTVEISDDNSGGLRLTEVGRGAPQRPGISSAKNKTTVDTKRIRGGKGGSSSEKDGYTKQPSKPPEHTSHTPASSGGRADAKEAGESSNKKKKNRGIFAFVFNDETGDDEACAGEDADVLMKKEKAVHAAEMFLAKRHDHSDPKYSFWKHYEWNKILPDIGGRISKVWVLLKRTGSGDGAAEYEHLLLNVILLTPQCMLDLEDADTLRKLNELMERLSHHPYISPVLEIDYILEDRQAVHKTREVGRAAGHVVIVQPFYTKGSLKDLRYKCTPSDVWSNKYTKSVRHPLPQEEVSRYGRQLLEALCYLKELPKEDKSKKQVSGVKQVKRRITLDVKCAGFPPLGHLQSGNVFVVDGHCELTGYVLRLLGYKTRLQKLFKDYPEHIDVLMFGHLVFEMAAGHELTTTKPTEKDYADVKKDELRVLKYIFADLEDGQPYPQIEDLLCDPYFKGPAADSKLDLAQISVTNGMLGLIQKC